MRTHSEIPIGRSRGPSYVCLCVGGYEVVFIRRIREAVVITVLEGGNEATWGVIREAVVITVLEGGNEATWGVIRDHSGGSASSPSSRASRWGNWYRSPGLVRT